MHERDVGALNTLGECHPQRVEDAVGAHVGGELPADDRAAEGVEHEREEDDAFPAAQVGEVRDTRARPGREAVKSRSTRSAGSNTSAFGEGGALRLAAPFGALDAVCTHQPFDPAAADLLAGAPEQGLPHPPGAVGEVVAPRGSPGSAPVAARPRPGGPTALLSHAGSTRTPTRPGPRQIGSTPGDSSEAGSEPACRTENGRREDFLIPYG